MYGLDYYATLTATWVQIFMELASTKLKAQGEVVFTEKGKTN